MRRRWRLVGIVGGGVLLMGVAGVRASEQTVLLTANAEHYDIGDPVTITATITNAAPQSIRATLRTEVIYPTGTVRLISQKKGTLGANRTVPVTVLKTTVPSVPSGVYTVTSTLLETATGAVLAQGSAQASVGEQQ